MLKQFLKTKQAQLDSIVAQKQQATILVQQEQSRLQNLGQYNQILRQHSEVTSSLKLQNSMNMTEIVGQLMTEQTEKVEQAKSDLSQHEKACIKQAAFNKGVEMIIEKKEREQRALEARREQKSLDEVSTQMFSTRNSKSGF